MKISILIRIVILTKIAWLMTDLARVFFGQDLDLLNKIWTFAKIVFLNQSFDSDFE